MSNFDFPQPQRVTFNDLHKASNNEPDSGPNQGPDGELIQKVQSGQKLINLAILLKIGGFVVVLASTNPAAGNASTGIVVLLCQLGILIALPMSVVGICRMAAGLGYGIMMRLVFCFLMFVPLAALITLLSLNGSATKVLRANGYTVGLMGAKPKM